MSSNYLARLEDHDRLAFFRQVEESHHACVVRQCRRELLADYALPLALSHVVERFVFAQQPTQLCACPLVFCVFFVLEVLRQLRQVRRRESLTRV